MRIPLFLFALVVACKGDSTTAEDTNPTTTSAGDIAVSCAAQSDNALRWDCTFELDEAAPAQVSWEMAAGGPTMELDLESASSHSFTMYFLRGKTDYSFHVSAGELWANGSFTTDAFDDAPDISATGHTTQSWMLITAACADEPMLLIVDSDSEIVWYQTFPGGQGGQGGISYNWTPQGTVVAVVSETIYEYDLAGNILVDFSRGGAFDAPLHHDVFKASNGLIYAMYQELLTNTEGDWIVDGLFLFDGDGLVADWSSAPYLDPVDDGSFGGGGGGPGGGSEFGDAVEYTHGNGVYVDEQANGYVSFRHLDTVWKVNLDPDDANFGDLIWQLVGTEGGQLTSDFDMSASAGLVAGFSQQHHSNPVPGGGLALFDNLGDSTSRGIILQLDEAAGTAEVVESYDTGTVCFAQGGHYPLANGNRLVTCATEQTVLEFEPGGADPIWTFDLQCDDGGGGGGGGGGQGGGGQGGGGSVAPRGIPVVFP